MDSTMTYCVYLNMEDFHQSQTTSFLVSECFLAFGWLACFFHPKKLKLK